VHRHYSLKETEVKKIKKIITKEFEFHIMWSIQDLIKEHKGEKQ
jgi:hypothetical protein